MSKCRAAGAANSGLPSQHERGTWFMDAVLRSRILALVGAVNIPIIKFSVDWWNTLHQPASVFRMSGSTIDASLLTPLFVMGAAFLALFVLLHLIAMRAEILRRRVRALQQTQVARAALAEVEAAT